MNVYVIYSPYYGILDDAYEDELDAKADCKSENEYLNSTGSSHTYQVVTMQLLTSSERR